MLTVPKREIPNDRYIFEVGFKVTGNQKITIIINPSFSDGACSSASEYESFLTIVGEG